MSAKTNMIVVFTAASNAYYTNLLMNRWWKSITIGLSWTGGKVLFAKIQYVSVCGSVNWHMQRALSLNCTSRSTCWSYRAPSWNPTPGLGCSQVSQWFWPPTWQHHGYASTSHHVAPSPSMLTALSCTDFGIGLVVFMGYTRNNIFFETWYRRRCSYIRTHTHPYKYTHATLPLWASLRDWAGLSSRLIKLPPPPRYRRARLLPLKE
jgi:hypothetical protein